MIAKTAAHPSFGYPVGYVANPEKGEVIALHNISGDTPEALAERMALVAEQSRAKDPAWHLIVSWDPTDMPSQDQMREAAQRLLDRLGLGEHQAVVAAHHDRPHAHMHIVANRVHPLHGQQRADGSRHQAWRAWKVYPVIERELRAMEREFGWRYVAGDHHLEPGVPHAEFDDGKPPRRPTQPPETTVPDGLPPGLPRTARALVACHKDAARGNAEDQYRAGAMFELGAGVRGDADKAMFWYAQAAHQGHPRAREAYDRCRRQYGSPRWPAVGRSGWGLGPIAKRKQQPGVMGRSREDEDEDDFAYGL